MPIRRIAIAVVVLAVLGGAALFVLDRTIFAPVAVSTALPVAPTLAAPEQPTAAPTQAATQPADAPAPTPADASGAQVYRIDASQSEVRYEVGETFFQGNRFQVAVGRTRGIAGDILVDFQNPAASQIGTVVIDVSQFTSDESRRDNFIRREGLQSSQYPTATFEPTAIEGLPASVASGDTLSLKVTGNLTVKQTTKPVTWDVTLSVQEGRLEGTATTQILMSDFGVGPIQIVSLATEDEVKLTFDFVALPVEG